MSAVNKNRKTLNASKNKGNAVHGASTTSRRSIMIDNTNKSKATTIGNRTTFAGSRTVLSSSSRKNVAPGSEKGDKITVSHRPPVTVIDDNGMDVTPQPLLHLDPQYVRKNQSNILGESTAGTPTDLQSVASFYQTGTVTASTFGGGPFTRSVFSQSTSERDTESITDDFVEQAHADLTSWADIRHQREDAPEQISEEDLERIVDISLEETDTIWLLDLPTVCVSSESDDAQAIKERSEKYKELCKSRAGNDMYADRGMNTYNDPPKLKFVQTTKILHNEVGVMATNWDMYDTFELAKKIEEQLQAEAEARNAAAGSNSSEEDTKQSSNIIRITDSTVALLKNQPTTSEKSTSEVVQTSTVTSDSRATMTSSVATDSNVAIRDLESEEVIDRDAEIMKSNNLKRDLFVMERVVNLNTYQPKQASYRGFTVLSEQEPDDEQQQEAARSLMSIGPSLDRLWAYTCPLIKGRNVSCMSWNKKNPDLFAVGYGQFEFTNQKPGMVCCWSLKNPEFPERIYTSEAGVTAMDFSIINPNLLAVGLHDGTVAVYNVRNSADEVMLDSTESLGKHIGPVWQLKWIEKPGANDGDRQEVLISVSTDGRVTQWLIRKGFECSDLMKLKRVQMKQAGGGKREKKSDALISRLAGGISFDFNHRDSNIYIAGTEEGHIHKCSCSYNEQFLDTYSGHGGPIYCVQWNPFVNDVFLSCSADWSIRLWLQERPNPILSFFSSTKAVHAVCWSPKSSTVFACVNEGAVEVWDLNVSTLDPIIVNTPVGGVKLTTVAFARNSDSLLVGDSEGQVTVYQLHGMPPIPDDQNEQLMKIVQSSLASQLQSNTDAKEKQG